MTLFSSDSFIFDSHSQTWNMEWIGSDIIVAGTGEEYHGETPEFIGEYRPLFHLIDGEFHRYI